MWTTRLLTTARAEDTVEIECVAIDDYLKGDEKIGFIKIDVQGYDYYAIKGAAGTISNSPSLVILGELWPYALKKAGIEPSDYPRLLEALGFSLRVPHIGKHNNFDEMVHDRYYYTDFYAVKRTGDSN